jgi:hypothetical protein
MSDRSINAYQKKGNTISAWVWYEGVDALKEGQGVCYNWDYGTAASVDARRYNRVELPTILNAPHFAGVSAMAHAASATGQLIEIYLPGSVCPVLTKKSLTIGVGRITCQAGGTLAGYFTAEGFEGKGSAVPLQTLDTSTTAATTLCVLEEGPQSGLQEVISSVTGGAITCMVGGVTHFATTTITGSDKAFTMANGTKIGQLKRFVCDGAQSSYNVVITVNGIRVDGSTASTTVTLTEAADEFTVQWFGDWYEKGQVAATYA